MTPTEMADWLGTFSAEQWERDLLVTGEVRTLDAIAGYLRQSCATCQHADTENAEDGWCFCAAPLGGSVFHALTRDPQFPFRNKAMPLDEKCKGFTPREV